MGLHKFGYDWSDLAAAAAAAVGMEWGEDSKQKDEQRCKPWNGKGLGKDIGLKKANVAKLLAQEMGGHQNEAWEDGRSQILWGLWVQEENSALYL